VTGLAVSEREMPGLLRALGLPAEYARGENGGEYSDTWAIACPECGDRAAQVMAAEGGGLTVSCPACQRAGRVAAWRSYSVSEFVGRYVAANRTAAVVPRLEGAEADLPRPMTWFDLVQAEVPEVPWLVEGLLPRQGLGSLLADTDVGKTWLACDAAISVAAGESVWGAFPVAEAGPVLILDEENGEAELRRRLSMLAKSRGLLGDPPVFALCHQGWRVDEQPSLTVLRRVVEECGAVLVVLDSLVRFHGQDENSNSGMAKVTAGLRALTEDTGAAILALHHPRKLGMVSNAPIERARGAKEMVAGLDSYLFARKSREGVIAAEVAKLRHGRPPAPFTLRLEEGEDGGMHVAYGGDASATEDKLTQAQQAILRAVEEAGGVLDRPSILEACKRERVGERTGAEALARLERDEQLRKVRKEGRRQLYGLPEEGLG